METDTAPEDAPPLVQTNYAAYDDSTLSWMLHRGAPDILKQLADGWGIVGVSLDERAHDMEIEYRQLAPTWTGEAAQHFADSIQSLILATQKVGKMAAVVSEIMHSNESALRQARSMFPPPDGFQQVANRPTVWSLPAGTQDAAGEA
jgi:uncharacterized protein YukE